MKELIRRAESIERAAWRSLYEGASEELRRRLGLQVLECGGATVLSAQQIDHLFLNRAIGLGPSADAVDEALRCFEERGIPRFWVHAGSELRYSPLPNILENRGITPYPRSWMKFVRRSEQVDRVDAGSTIRSAVPEDATQLGEILASGFDLPAEAAPLFAGGIGREGWSYVVAGEEEILAAAAVYTQGEDGYLAFAATRPEARRRGCQRALMAARLEEAQRLGCRRVFTETGMPVEGDRNSSYRNILRAGFDELHVRDNFAPEGTRWDKLPLSDAIAKSAASPRPSKTWLKDTARSGT